MREVGKNINLHSRDVMYSACSIYHIEIFFIPGRDKRKQEQPSNKKIVFLLNSNICHVTKVICPFIICLVASEQITRFLAQNKNLPASNGPNPFKKIPGFY